MRTILKIIAAPFILALILAVAVLSFLSCVAGAVCVVACVGQLRESCDISGCINVRMGGLHIFVHSDAPAVRLDGKAFQT